MLDESTFHELADEFLMNLEEAIELADEDGIVDAELLDGVMTITFEDSSEMVINKHGASCQIWVSSPESGASHFSFDEEEEEWRSSDGDMLHDLLVNEFANIANLTLDF